MPHAWLHSGTYKPKGGDSATDKAMANIAKGVTAAKINFRVYTAFKQILSAPAFLTDVDLDDFVKNAVNPKGSFKWAMENMPVFEKRWKSRQVGDTRLMEDATDWKMWKSKAVQNATRWAMSANAFVDAVTCAVGARSIYESRLKKYKKLGMDDAAAEKHALQDAEIGYNLTQQSSEGAFVSAIQKDRTVLANALSVFRNSSMSYTRQWVDAARNLKHRTQKGYREDSINFMAKQMERELGIDEATAKEAAEKEYARALRHDVARMLNMMFGVTIAWNLGASLPYLLLGDDSKTKKEMLKDAALKGIIAGPTEGLVSGNIFSDMVSLGTNEQVRRAYRDEGVMSGLKTTAKQMGDYDINPLPLMADLEKMIEKLGYDSYAAAQDLFNICVQSTTGVNPQSVTDMWNACIDYGNPSWMPFVDNTKHNTNGLANAQEIAMFIMRLTNAPATSWRNKYVDELGMNSEEAKKLSYDEMAARYANYKHWKDTPLTGLLRGQKGRAEKIDKLQGQFDKAVKERMERLTEEELITNLQRTQSMEERRALANTIAKRFYGTNSVDGKKPKETWQENYMWLMDYNDIKEDDRLSATKKLVTDEKAKKEIEKRLDWMRDGKKFGGSVVTKGKKQLYTGDNQKVMDNIRQWRKEALEIAEQSLNK